MDTIKNFPNNPLPGLVEEIERSGLLVECEGGIWKASDAAQAEAIASAYDPTGYVRAAKSAELADARWQKETGGFMFQPSGADRPYRFVSTREAMGPVMGAVMAVQAGVFPDPTMWKTAEGVFVPITAADVVPLFKAFAAHVAAAFAEEATKRDEASKAPWEDVGGIVIEAATADKP